MSKIRIYEFAKELRLDNKKVIDEAKRLGVDVHQPSNSLSDEIANKIREKYFPKKLVSKAGPILVKKAAKPADEAPPVVEEPEEVDEPISASAEDETSPVADDAQPADGKSKVIRLVKPPEPKRELQMPPTAALEPPKPIVARTEPELLLNLFSPLPQSLRRPLVRV